MRTKQSAASDPRDATLLTVVSHDRESGQRHIMTKHYVRTENGEIKSKSYGNAYLFDVKMVRFDSLDAIAGTLKNATPHQCIIRGGLIPGVPTVGANTSALGSRQRWQPERHENGQSKESRDGAHGCLVEVPHS